MLCRSFFFCYTTYIGGCMRYFVKFLIFALVLVIVSPFVWPVSGSPATRQRLAELEQARLYAASEIYMQELRLYGLREEAQVILDEIRYIDMQMTTLQNSIFLLEESLVRTDIEIYYANASMYAARQKLEIQIESFGLTLRAMQEADPISALDILFGADSIGDFFIRFEAVRELLMFNAGAIERLEAVQKDYLASIDALSILHARNSDIAFQFELEREYLSFSQNERQLRFAELIENEESLQLVLEILHEEHVALETELGATRTAFDTEEASFELTRRASGNTPSQGMKPAARIDRTEEVELNTSPGVLCSIKVRMSGFRALRKAMYPPPIRTVTSKPGQ